MISDLFRLVASHDFRNAVFNQLWKLFSGPLILLLIPVFLTAEEQGFWFTFTSLAALVIFADMGFSTILLQFSAHEFANLSFDKNREIKGEENSKFKLASLWEFSMRWAVFMGVMVFPIILIVGFLLFRSKSSEVEWVLPWVIYGTVSVLTFINSVSLSFFEGCDSVGDVQQLRLKISLVNVGSTVGGLLLGGGLYSLVVGLLLSALFGFYSIRKKYIRTINQFSTLNGSHQYQWGKVIFPLLGKYAVSWVSGYFIFQAFTPIAFYNYGAEASGKVGLSLAAVMAIFGISNVWMIVITPKINMLVAMGCYAELNSIFWRHLNASAVTFTLGMAAFFLAIIFLGDYFPINKRLSSPILIGMLAIGWFAQIYVNGMAVYARAHKQEPLMWFSVAMGVYIIALTAVASKAFPVEYFLIGFVTSYIWAVPAVIKIFRNFYLK